MKSVFIDVSLINAINQLWCFYDHVNPEVGSENKIALPHKLL